MKRIVAILPLVALGACSEVPAGHRGVFTSYGAPTEVVKEGLHWYNPWSYDLTTMDVRQIKWSGETEAYTKDVQQAKVAFTLTYRLDPSPKKVLAIYRNVGEDWASKLVPQVVQEAIKDVFGQSEAVKDTINNRAVVRAKMQDIIRKRLAARSIIVEGFELRDIEFSAAFEKAVEAKQVAVENALAERNKTAAVRERAAQRVIAAEADAKAMQIKTQALAGNAKLVEYEAVQRWDGKLPANMYGGGAIPFISAK